ncbi:MAG: ATP synthase F1 subunit gamma [Planctomycetes bacterium]|nr:ATP synthase F1 subunit gamma [Planctomycetota bacterium]
MANIRELRGRIRSVRGIRQITRAMEMVATTKLRRFQERAVRSRPYANEIEDLVLLLAAYVARESEIVESGAIDRSLLTDRGDARIAVLLVASDRGLCGAYNSNIFACFEKWRAGFAGKEITIFPIGRKAADYVKKRGYQRAGSFQAEQLEKMSYADTANVARELLAHFRSGKCDQLHLVSTAFESMAKYVPNAVRLLPLDREAVKAKAAAGEKAKAAGDERAERRVSGPMLLEPDPATIFNLLLPRFLETRVFNALMESLTSEFASRRFSMKNATEAADEMIGTLQRVYNRVRQERITKELLEIVGGAEALRG